MRNDTGRRGIAGRPDGSRGCLLVAATLALLVGTSCETEDAWIRRHFAVEQLSFPGEVITLPTTRWDALFLVEATFADSGPHIMILDTGVYETMVANDVGGNLPQDEEGHRRIAALQIGAVELRDVAAVTHDLSDIRRAMGTQVSGILGMGAFSECLLTFDYPAGEVRLSRGALRRDDSTWYYGLDTQARPTLPIALDSLRDHVMLDTGAAADLVLPSLDGVRVVDLPKSGAPLVNLSGTYRSSTARAAATARIGPLEIDQPRIQVNLNSVPIAGARLFRDHAVTFDQRQQLVRFEHARH